MEAVLCLCEYKIQIPTFYNRNVSLCVCVVVCVVFVFTLCDFSEKFSHKSHDGNTLPYDNFKSRNWMSRYNKLIFYAK